MSTEASFVATFIVRQKRERYASFLSDPAKRDKILERLNHAFDYDERFATQLPGDAKALDVLRARGAPNTCHVIAHSHPLDGEDVALDAALDGLFWHMFGYVVICVPDRLALYCPEAPAPLVLLEAKGRG